MEIDGWKGWSVNAVGEVAAARSRGLSKLEAVAITPRDLLTPQAEKCGHGCLCALSCGRGPSAFPCSFGNKQTIQIQTGNQSAR
jgi:hypothetical protein